MKEVAIAGLVLVLGGCVDLHTKSCSIQKAKGPYLSTEFCHHILEYTTETPVDEAIRR